jgi:uncharacterized protein YndB with AHSA1/START domain
MRRLRQRPRLDRQHAPTSNPPRRTWPPLQWRTPTIQTVPTTRASRQIRAPRRAVYQALLDRNAVQQWMVPEGMTSEIHEFDAREGGSFRISLTYNDESRHGKTSEHTDTFQGTFVKLVPDSEIVQVVEFETDLPSLRGRAACVCVEERQPIVASLQERSFPWNVNQPGRGRSCGDQSGGRGTRTHKTLRSTAFKAAPAVPNQSSTNLAPPGASIGS